MLFNKLNSNRGIRAAVTKRQTALAEVLAKLLVVENLFVRKPM